MELEKVVLLPAEPRAAGAARAVVRDRLRAWDLEDLLDTVVLLTSELVTNVLVHTASAPALAVARTGEGVRVEVSDTSPVPPARRRHSPSATTGRGVKLLEDLADDWGCEVTGDGKVVWFTVTGLRDPWAAFSADALLGSPGA